MKGTAKTNSAERRLRTAGFKAATAVVELSTALDAPFGPLSVGGPARAKAREALVAAREAERALSRAFGALYELNGPKV